MKLINLDTRFSRDIVHGVICLAFDVLEDISGERGKAQKAAHAGAAAAGPECEPSILSPLSFQGLELDEYDEATRLEADALLGSPRQQHRPSDPIGEDSRRARIMYHYR